MKHKTSCRNIQLSSDEILTVYKLAFPQAGWVFIRSNLEGILRGRVSAKPDHQIPTDVAYLRSDAVQYLSSSGLIVVSCEAVDRGSRDESGSGPPGVCAFPLDDVVGQKSETHRGSSLPRNSSANISVSSLFIQLCVFCLFFLSRLCVVIVV
jgi:hypothetical protein